MGKDTKIIASIDIDSKSLKKSMAEIKEEIEDLQRKQEKLTDKGKEATKGFIENEAALRKLNELYKAQSKALAENMDATGKLQSRKEQIVAATNAVNKSENDYIANTAELIRLKKELNSNGENYEKRLAAINGKLLENNNWLKENGSEHARLITTMSDYKQQVIESFDSINIFNGGITGFISRAQEAGGVGSLLKNAFGGITGGIVGMTKAAWGFVTNPIGAIIAALVLAVQAGVAIFSNFTPLIQKVEQVMAAVGAVVESVKNSFIGLLTGATSLGDLFSGFAGSAADAANEAMNLKEAQQKLAEQTAQQAVANEEAKKSIDGYMRTVQDSTKTEGERLQALKDAAEVEKSNMKERRKIAEDSYNLAVGQLANGKNLTDKEKEMLRDKGFAYAQELAERKAISKEELDMLQKAHIERTKLYGEEAALSHRQAADLKKFHEDMQAEKDAAAAKDKERRQKILDDALTKQKQLLDLFVAESEGKAKSLAAQLKYEEDYAAKSVAILKQELKNKKITRLEYETAIKELDTGLLQKKAALTADHLTAEANLYREEHKSKLAGAEVINQELIDAEKARLEHIYKLETEALTKKMDMDAVALQAKRDANLQMTAEEMNYLAEVKAMKSKHDEDLAAADKLLSDADATAKADKIAKDTEAAQAEYDQKIADGQSKYDLDRALVEERYQAEMADIEAKRATGLESSAFYDQLEVEAKKRKSDNVKAIDKEELDYKLAMQHKLMGEMGAILGKESKAGKAFAIGQATIDTYQGAVRAYNTQLVPLDPTSPVRGAIAAAAVVAAGLKNIQKISGVKETKFEKGGLMHVGGNRHSAGGTLFQGADGTSFEAEQGELIGVMNRNAASHFMAFNNAFPSGGASAPNYFAGGGIVSREIAQPSLNMDELAVKIANANRAIPAPVVSVEDIIVKGNSYVQVREGANF